VVDKKNLNQRGLWRHVTLLDLGWVFGRIAKIATEHLAHCSVIPGVPALANMFFKFCSFEKRDSAFLANLFLT